MTPVFKAFHEFGVDDMPPQAEIYLVQLKTAIMAPGMRHRVRDPPRCRLDAPTTVNPATIFTSWKGALGNSRPRDDPLCVGSRRSQRRLVKTVGAAARLA
jgi:hypothetical protein